MARRKTDTPQKVKELPKYRCRDCAHSYGWCDKALDGRMILCRCPYDEKTGRGKWCKFLSDYPCEHFEKRKTEDDGEA